eukprot:scaffold18051_cov78-Skeletonema_dohrnii-CCMP3373.AAC.2
MSCSMEHNVEEHNDNDNEGEGYDYESLDLLVRADARGMIYPPGRWVSWVSILRTGESLFCFWLPIVSKADAMRLARGDEGNSKEVRRIRK